MQGAARGVGRRAWKGLLVAAAALSLAALPGCRVGQAPADLERGRALFQQHCGVCHALSEAGTTATIAPDLDATFADPRASGMTDTTIEGVTRDQIANPRFIREGDPFQDQVFMPPDIVTGQDAHDVAAYVGSVAGVPGIEPPDLPPEELFTERCGGCHTLSAAGTLSDVGPNLDEFIPMREREEVREAIVDPMAIITPGFEPGIMPSFEDVLTPEELDGLVDYLLEVTGNGNGNANGNGNQGQGTQGGN